MMRWLFLSLFLSALLCGCGTAKPTVIESQPLPDLPACDSQFCYENPNDCVSCE